MYDKGHEKQSFSALAEDAFCFIRMAGFEVGAVLADSSK